MTAQEANGKASASRRDVADMSPLLPLVKSYANVARMKLTDLRRSLQDGCPVLLVLGIGRMETVLGWLVADAEKLSAPPPDPAEQMERMAANNAELVMKYSALGGKIREHLAATRSSFGPETEIQVVDSVMAISDCVKWQTANPAA